MSAKVRELIAKTHEEFGTCLTAERLKEDFQKLGISVGMTLMVHCSLSTIGWISGGAVTIIKVLLDLLGPDGTLIMPSHTAENSDPKHWQNPPVPPEWFDVIRQTMPGFDPDIEPTRCMGNHHPQYSVIAAGPQAKLITDKHHDACGEQSPLARLYDCGDNGYVLLLGIQHKNNTSLHLAEYRSQINNNVEKIFTDGAAIINPETKTRQWIEWNDYDYNADDFNDAGNAFESIEGNVKIGKVGLAECRLMKQYLLIDFATDWFTKNRLKQ